MEPVLLRDVFKLSGVPTATFVPPAAFGRLVYALSVPGRGLVVEGPSGIGKSTAVEKALADLGTRSAVTILSGRDPEDLGYIDALPELGKFGTVIIDDFHRLDDATKQRVADLLKVTADREDADRKLVIIGINEAGRTLVETGSDVANRVEVIRFEVEPPQQIDKLVSAGEDALDATFIAKDLIVENSRGSFYVAQMLCTYACIQAGFQQRASRHTEIGTTYAEVQRIVVERQRDRFGGALKKFARGTKFRPSGRAPYLHILKWLSDSESWSIHVPEEMRRHPNEKASVGIVYDRGYLKDLTEQEAIAKLVHFDPDTGVLSVEDPMLIFFLRAINWSEFVKDVGFTKVDYEQAYDVALSFAGEDRPYAEALRNCLEDLGHSVFYDFAEQHRIIGNDLEAYLKPIYESNSRYVVAILGKTYGYKRWTLFESTNYMHRFREGQVLPIWEKGTPASAFDETRSRGALDFDSSGDLILQARAHAEIISKRLAE